MTSFARHSCHARPNASIEHQTASDPCTEGEYRQVFNIFPGSKPFFTKGSYVGVVFHDYTGPETLFNLVFDRGSSPPRQIGRFAHYSGLAVDDARRQAIAAIASGEAGGPTSFTRMIGMLDSLRPTYKRRPRRRRA